MEEILNFIDFINDLVNDEFDYFLDCDSKYYFTNGGCLEFAKILNHYYKNGEMVINKEYNHIALKIDNKIYDAYGIVTWTDYELIKEEDIKMLEAYNDNYEILFEHKKPSIAVINEIAQIKKFKINN